MVYVDDFAYPKDKHLWYHLISDTDEKELHQFAERIGLKREWYHGNHYDVTQSKRAEAIKNGAIAVTAKQLIEIMRKSKYAIL